jgi:YVTN family beta-propeller protein
MFGFPENLGGWTPAHGERCRRRGLASAALAAGVLACATACPAWAAGGDARSTNIALNRSGTLLFVANREADSLTVFSVKKGGGDVLTKLAEVPVGEEPVCVAASGQRAFVANAVSGTVSVVEKAGRGFVESAEFAVGAEPRGCALAGKHLFVTNYTEGTVAIVDTTSRKVVNRVKMGGNPYGITIDGHNVFVTQFFARLIEGGPGEGFDDGKEGVVQRFRFNNFSVNEITLSPLADSGFTANRVNLCQQFNPMAANNTFCPDPNATDPNDPAIAQAPAAVHPNQLKTALACKRFLYLPSVGAQPEPPVAAGVNFDTNVQALVHVVDIRDLSERADLHVNLNQQIAMEPAPSDPASLERLFGNELVAIDADRDCENFFLVSRGGNYVLKARLGPDGKLDIGAPDNVVRFQTGNIPTGIVVDRDGKLGFVNNQVNMSVSVLDLEGNTVIAQDVPSSTPPEPGTFDHTRMVGQLVFFTALGVPDNGLVGTPLLDLVPLDFRGKQSRDAWSSCGSCHDEGLADGITWIFGDGPRQTIPMDGLYSKVNGAHDTRINNWSAARDSVTDFNNNSRGVQGGVGFASDPPFSAAMPNPNIFDHGISQGASEALDFETTWAQTIRPLNAPQPEDVEAGAAIFEENCASCHGGAKWTKSQVLYLNNPGFTANPAAGGVPRDPGVAFEAAQIISYLDTTVDPDPLVFLEPNIGAFDPANPIEIRQNGAPSLGALGLNVPSLLGVGNNAPYFHNGLAQTLEEVFEIHQLPGGGTIADLAGADDLLDFVRAIDGTTANFRSDADPFHEPATNGGVAPTTQ